MIIYLLYYYQIIEGKIFCVHGGLSPNISTIDQIRLINRKMEIPHEGPFCGNKLILILIHINRFNVV